MIRKVKTDINGISGKGYSEDSNSKNNSSYTYDIESKNSHVEELNLEVTNNSFSSQNNIVTENMVMDAISDNFKANRNITNDMNRQIYNSVMEKISQYISNSGGDI